MEEMANRNIPDEELNKPCNLHPPHQFHKVYPTMLPEKDLLKVTLAQTYLEISMISGALL